MASGSATLLRDQLKRYGIRKDKTTTSGRVEDCVFLEGVTSPCFVRSNLACDEENQNQESLWCVTCLYCEKDYLWQNGENKTKKRMRAFQVLASLAESEGYLPSDAYLVRPGTSSRVRLCNSPSCCNPFHRTWNPEKERANRFEKALREHSAWCNAKGIPDQPIFNESVCIKRKHHQATTTDEFFSTGTFTVYVGKVGRNMHVYMTDDIIDSASVKLKLVVVPLLCSKERGAEEEDVLRSFNEDEYIGGSDDKSKEGELNDCTTSLHVKRTDENNVFVLHFPAHLVYHSTVEGMLGEDRRRVRFLDMRGTLRKAGGSAGVMAAVQGAVLAAFKA